MINFLRRYFATDTVSRELRSNFIHLYFDIGWWGLYAGATVAFLTIYAARIGATPEQIGLLTALPALLAMLLSLPLGRVLRGMQARKAAFLGAFIGRLMLVAYVIIPAVLPNQQQIWAILIAATLMAVPNTLVGISFSKFFMEGVPLEYRGTVVGVRNAMFAILSFVVTLVSGQLLDAVAFPVGYQIVFFIGFVGALMTAYHIWHVLPVGPDAQTAAPPNPVEAATHRGGLIPPIDAQGRRYLRVLGMLFLYNTINSMVAPLAPEVLVNRLQLSDATIGVGTALTAMLQFIVSLFIAGLARRMGNRNGTALGAALLAGQALALALAQNEATYLLSAVIGGVGTGILLTTQFNYHLENVPENERASWLAIALLQGNAALLIGALVGPLLAGGVGLVTALVLLAAARLAIGGTIWKWG